MPDIRRPGTTREQLEDDKPSREVRRGHEAAEDTDPPADPHRVPTRPEWPPPSVEHLRPGAGNPRSEAPIGRRVEGAHKSFVAVFGIISILFAAAAGGWSAHVFLSGPIIAKAISDAQKPVLEQLAELKKEQDVNQRANETSFAGIGKDIEWLKREKKVVESEPIKSEKPHR